MMESRERWGMRGVEVVPVSASASDDAEDDVEEGEGEIGGVVCVPVSRWKSSVGSEVVDEASLSSTPPWAWSLVAWEIRGSGITETTLSSFVLRVERLEEAVSKRE